MGMTQAPPTNLIDSTYRGGSLAVGRYQHLLTGSNFNWLSVHYCPGCACTVTVETSELGYPAGYIDQSNGARHYFNLVALHAKCDTFACRNKNCSTGEGEDALLLLSNSGPSAVLDNCAPPASAVCENTSWADGTDKSDRHQSAFIRHLLDSRLTSGIVIPICDPAPATWCAPLSR